MNYNIQYGLSVAVAVAGAMLVAVHTAGPVSLGLSTVIINWLSIINAGLIVLASVLPSVRRPPDDARRGLD